MQEEWRDIIGYEGLYQVSNLGRVKSFWRGRERIKKPVKAFNGYLHIELFKKGGKRKGFTVHRLVASAFIPNPLNKREVNHVNGVKTDNRVENLEWATSSENKRHAVATGLHINPKGEDSGRAKLTNAQVKLIRDNPNGLSCRALAEKFGVHERTIGDIQRGKKYKSVGGVIRDKIGTRLPNELRAEIRRLYVRDSREFGSYALAKKYGCTYRTILNIIHEK